MQSLPIPSIWFCLTGRLMRSEEYHQDVHSHGKTVRQRAPKLLDWYTLNEIENWFLENRKYCETVLTEEQLAEIYAIVRPLPLQ